MVLVSLTVGLVALLLLGLYAWRTYGRAVRAERAERLAAERRDRFLVEAARELTYPLGELRTALLALESGPVVPGRLQALAGEAERLANLVDELARLAPSATHRDSIDLAEVVREVVEEAPFPDRGPPVIVRATPAMVMADRERLLGGLRILFWVLRREANEMVVTISKEEQAALLEIDTQGDRAAADAVEQLPSIFYGLTPIKGTPGTTLALRIAAQVAESQGGRLMAHARAGEAGERFVLELPAASA